MFEKIERNIGDILVHLSFIILFVFAFVYSEERIFADSSYYLAKVIQNKNFWIEHDRVVLFFAEILPVLSVWLGLKLKAIVILYSLNHPLFYYTLFLITRYLIKSKDFNYFFIFIQVLGFAHAYTVPIFELYYGVGFMILFWSIFKKNIFSKKRICALILLGIIISLSHPFANILMLVISGFFMLGKTKIKVWNYLFVFIPVIGAYFLKSNHISEYEAEKSEAILRHLTEGVWKSFFTQGYLSQFYHFYLPQYLDVFIIFIIVLLAFLVSKRYSLLLYYLIAVLGVCFIVNLTHGSFEKGRYMEQLYFPLTVVIAWPFIMFIPEIFNKYRKWIFVLFFALFISRILFINSTMKDFVARTNVLKSYIQYALKTDKNKIVINEAIMEQKYIGPNWSFPIESMFLSAFSGKEKTITVCSDVDYFYNHNDSLLKPGEYLFRRFEIYSISQVNKTYFQLDSSGYSFLPEQSQRLLDKQ